MDDIAIITPIQAQTAPGMSNDESAAMDQEQQVESISESSPRVPTEPAAMASENKKRPRLDLSDTQKRKRGGMFGLLLGTLNKAKIEDKERSASEAAKKRQLIDQRLQTKLRKETDSVRRAEEARKDKLNANRKEEDLQLKDSVYKLRRGRLPLLANFLLTSDIIPTSSSDEDPSPLPPALASVQRGHPPPLYYLPAILTPAQESYIRRRKAQVLEAVDAEYAAFLQERSAGIEEISELRKAVASEEARKKSETEENEEPPSKEGAKDVEMEVDDRDSATMTSKDAEEELEKKEEPTPVPADGDDAVEY